MNRNEKFLKKCEKVVESALIEKLRMVQSLICETEHTQNCTEIKELLAYGNSLLRYACGDNERLYEEYRYRLFLTEDGRLMIFQGLELDIDEKDDSDYDPSKR